MEVKKIAEQIRSNVSSGAKIWEVKRRIEQKNKKDTNKTSDQK